jgi:hypothetical protein
MGAHPRVAAGMNAGDVAMSDPRPAVAPPPVRAARRWLWLRAAGAIALLVLIARFIDLDEVWPVLRALSATSMVFILALTAVTWGVSMFKWRTLLPAVSLREVAAFYFIGMLYSLVLPGQLAGEAVKAARLGARGPGLGQASASVVIDRLTSLVGLGVVSGVGLWLSGHGGQTFRTIGWAIGLLTLVFAATLFVIRVPAVNRWAEYSVDRGQVITTIVLAVVLQLGNVAIVSAIAAALNVPVAFADMAWVVGVVSMLTLVPISFGGVGVREAGFVGVLALIGIPAAQALSVSLICSLIVVIGALVGLVVELRWLHQARRVSGGR